MTNVGLTLELLEPRCTRTAFKATLVEIDKKDVCGIARLTRLGQSRLMHCKTVT